MNLKKRILIFCLILIAEIPLNSLFSQNNQNKPTRQSSFEAFSKGNYESAYSQFSELLLTYSKDPLYKYYSGVCLVRLNKKPAEAVSLLQQALQQAGTLRSLPPDGLFYLGRAQQMSGKYAEAIASYNSYTDQAGKKTAKEIGVPGFLRQCAEKKGQIAENEVKPVADVKTVRQDSVIREVKKPVSETVNKAAITSNTTTLNKGTLPSEYEKILNEAIRFQSKADSVTNIINKQKADLLKLTGIQRTDLSAAISRNEKIAASYQASANQKYHEAQLILHPEQDSLKRTQVNQNTNKGLVDTSKKTSVPTIKNADKQADTTNTANQQLDVLSFFDATAKTVDPSSKIIIDPVVPSGLIYRIQIAVFRNPVLPAFFKGLSPVYGFKIEGTDKISYSVGMFRKSADASKALASVKNKGFKDSFVVALLDNKRVSSDRAASLEKEWGTKAFYSIDKVIPETRDTTTRTLTFRVEVVKSPKPLTGDVVDGIRKIAGNRGLDIQLLGDGKIDYLVGKFITFETASEYADLLKRNGYREAVVVALLGKKQISIETAKKLIENLK